MASFADTRRHIAPSDDFLPDTLVSGIESIADIGGGLVRIIYYVNARSTDGMLERRLIGHAHVMPMCAVTDAIGKAMLVIGRKVIARDDGSLTVTH